MMDFTYRSYRRLLDHIRANGRVICPFNGIPAAGGYVILRHDIDYSVFKAREMAAVEHDAGVRSTMFLMLSSPYYNLLTVENLQAARDIATMGHEIGFHFDTDVVAGWPVEQQGAEIARQARFLGSVLGVEVTSVAQHNPSVTPVRVSVPGMVDAYDPKYTKQIAYVSDSRRLFGTHDLDAFFRTHERSQLLIHPLWYHETERSRWESFQSIHDALADDALRRLRAMNASMEADEARMRGSRS